MKKQIMMSLFLMASTSLYVHAAEQQPSAPAKTVAATIPSTGFPALDRYRSQQAPIFSDDYGQLARYRQQNAALAQEPASHRVVFFGDSITDIWKLDRDFPGKHYINRGIGGQTTSQMLVRFRQDVIDLKPKVVVILAGTNDIAGNTGYISDRDIEANYKTMSELAKLHHIQLVMASILPVHNYTESAQELYAQRPAERINNLNRWLKSWSEQNGIIWLDYGSALQDSSGKLSRDYSDDGVHPTEKGFKVMAPLAEKAVNVALQLSDKDSL